MVGKKVLVVTNLTYPVKLCGYESPGMILSASDNENLVLAGLDKDIICEVR